LNATASSRSLDVVNETLPGSFSSPSNTAIRLPVSPGQRPTIAVRRQSLVPSSQHHLINTLLEPNASGAGDYFSSDIQRDMIHRRVWVKRAGSSPTLVAVTEEDLVDDLRDAILKKFANSLGRTFDAPDIILKLIPREPSGRQGTAEHVLSPEEPVGRMLDNYYPGGQTVEEALIIELPQRRTPKPSPRQNVAYCHPDDLRPGEAGEYFPPLALIHTPPNVSAPASSTSGPGSHHPTPHSMAVITTGQLPAVPSPGNRASWHQQHRPKYPRQHTSSPTIITTSPSANMTGMQAPF
jgi:osomolarity two-component system response regulator SSK1